MKLLPTPFLSLAFLGLLISCRGSDTLPSQTKTLHGTADIHFLSDAERIDVAQAMGVLSVVVTMGEERMASPFCSAIRISPHHILSAAHCYQEGDELIFDTHYLVAEGEQQNFRFVRAGSEVRLSFQGLFDSSYQPVLNEAQKVLGAPRYLDRKHDFVIWELEENRQGQALSLAKIADLKEAKGLKLYSYPNSQPLAVSEACSFLRTESETEILHNCDSLNGSSGGLLVDAHGLAVALHSQGLGRNSWDHFQAKGYFEEENSFPNRAIPFATIRDQLRVQDPQLWNQIFSAQQASVL